MPSKAARPAVSAPSRPAGRSWSRLGRPRRGAEERRREAPGRLRPRPLQRQRARRLEFTGAQLGPRFRSPTTFSTSKATRRRSANAPARTPPRTRAPWSERLVSKARAASSTVWGTRRSPRLTRLEWAPRATCCARPPASSPRGRTRCGWPSPRQWSGRRNRSERRPRTRQDYRRWQGRCFTNRARLDRSQ